MEYKLTPRAERFVKWRRLAALATVVGVPYGIYTLLVGYTGFLFWAAFLVGSFFGCRIVFTILQHLIAMIIYNFDRDLMIQEAQEMGAEVNSSGGSLELEELEELEENAELELTITKVPDTPIGKYLDADIYEWIEFVDEKGITFIAFFEDTVNPKQMGTFAIPDDCILLPPGLLFKFKPASE